KKSLRALAVKGDAAKQPERGAIEALKAESHLHLTQFPQAGEAFTAAAKDSIDAKDIGLYRATALLIKRSPGGRYTPKPSPDAKEKSEPTDIVVDDSRKKAFAALYTDESKSVQ